MKYKIIILIITIVLVLGFIISFIFINKVKTTDINMIYINEVIKLAEKDIDYVGEKIYDYQIININEDNFYNTINQAIKNRNLVFDINIDGEIINKIIFFTDFETSQRLQQQKLTTIIGITFIILITICAFYIIYLQNNFYKPFNKLQKFATNIANGNLDLPLILEKNNVFGAFTESFDIMRCELKLAKHKENLANISKRELIASISHDIKTPVASIKAVSELLLAITNDEKLKPKLNIIYEKAEQINRLITDMFNATLEELGELKVIVTEEYSSILYELIKNSDYEIKVNTFNIPECIIKVDKLRLGQVIDNVFANSYKYANTIIDISCKLTNDYIELDVLDYGNGVNEDELPLLFNKFYRGSNINKQSGSGLGLYISKYLMEKQGGDIICFNHTNGFMVKIIIPLA